MAVSSGKGRLLNGSGGDRVKRNNLTEFRGSAWEMVTDYFFGVSTVDYDWNDVADETRLTKWIYTQDGAGVSDHTVVPGRHELDIGLTAGPDPISNQREMFTIPETGLWGIAHALAEIRGEAYEAGMALPQHGLALRAQEDTMRRAIVAWHDVFVGNPHAINVGVWLGSLDGSFFTNRQGNASLDLKQIYNITGASRVGGVVTADTAADHGLVVDDYLNISWTREFPGTSLNRAGNVVTATLGSGHQLQAGDTVFLFGASPGSFDGTHTVTSSNATQAFWAEVGSNESGSGNVKDRSSDVRQVQVTDIVDPTTFRYVDGKHDLTSLGTSTTANERLFPYWMEMRVSGTVIYVRCWSRHQSRPSWTQPYHAFNIDLDKPDRVYTVTASSRTGGISTLTIGANDFDIGNLITVDITDAGFDVSNGFVTGANATQVMYDNPGADNGSGGTGTALRVGGATTAADIAAIPTPRGSGRVAVAGAHEGIVQLSHVSYGEIVGTNSFDSLLQGTGQSVETETAQPVGRVKSRTLGQALETESAQPVVRPSDAPQIVAVQETALDTPSTSHILVVPASTVDTDRLLAVAVTGKNNTSPGTTWEAGWTELGDITSTEGTGVTLSAAWLNVEGTPPGDVTLTTVNNTDCAGVVLRINNHDPDTAPEAVFATDTSDPSNLAPSWGALEQLYLTAFSSNEDPFPVPGFPLPEHQHDVATSAVFLALCSQVLSAGSLNPTTWQSGSPEASGRSVLTLAMRGVGADGPVAVGQATELETAQPIARTKTRATVQASETETAQPVTRVKSRVLGQAAEAETATATGKSKLRAVAQATETESATAVTRVRTLAVGQVTETETATTAGRRKTRVPVQAAETETALSVTAGKLRTVAQSTETETVTVLGRAKTRAVVQVLEVETGQVITFTDAQLVNQATETESAQPVRAVKTLAVSQVSETETAGAVGRSKLRAVAQAFETETATHPTVVKLRTLAQAVETDTAQAFARIKALAVVQALETESAVGVILGVPDPPPSSRIVVVPAEDRTTVVPASHSTKVPPETRTLVVP